MIAVIATIELAEGRKEDFLREFRLVVPKVLAETGCIEYQPMLEMPTALGAASAARDNVVVVIEKWQNVATLEAHLMAPHMQEYRKRVKDWVVRVGLQVLEPAGNS
jgi:quinol monooxygenase YgiN